jgi:hypothetical protein
MMMGTRRTLSHMLDGGRSEKKSAGEAGGLSAHRSAALAAVARCG